MVCGERVCVLIVINKHIYVTQQAIKKKKIKLRLPYLFISYFTFSTFLF